MPHVIIEYSQAVAQQVAEAELVKCAHQATEASGLFNPMAIKTRARAYEFFRLGAPEADDFVHITIRLLPGRTEEQKRALSQGVYDAIAAMVEASLSVEVLDLPLSYVKG
ncbi:5-carboxymethyl-2-hydroxymuconate Delta-isomerase [Shewanella sp.]|uniref:5-carboxymethyl-2-hydroxymuconate Delta-isomerase n=1 Tax=Shewanella sp. TaxID=50422 RepID=UPI003A97A0EF